jgi:hypothetical protein
MDYINLAARLLHAAPTNCGDPLPDWKELERIGDLMRDAAVMLRRIGDERKAMAEQVEATRLPPVVKRGATHGKGPCPGKSLAKPDLTAGKTATPDDAR